MKRLIAFVLALTLFCVPVLADAFAPEADNALAAQVLGGGKLKKQAVKEAFATWEELGVGAEVLAVWKANQGYALLVRVDYGAEFYEEPSMAVYVGLDKNAEITGVIIADSYQHTEAFVGMVTEDYLAEHYAGQTASATFVTDAVSGATYSSDTVLYAVRLAAYYAANVLKIGQVDTVSIQQKKLMAVVPGVYTELPVAQDFSSDRGEVQYAASCVTADGRECTAMVVAAKFTPEDANNNMAMPVYQIWFDNADRTVIQANMLSGRFYEGYEMPEEKLAAYYGIPVESADAFAELTDGLITDAPEFILTSASQSFPDTLTGATPDGNDTSRAVKNCFVCAAEYFCAMG